LSTQQIFSLLFKATFQKLLTCLYQPGSLFVLVHHMGQCYPLFTEYILQLCSLSRFFLILKDLPKSELIIWTLVSMCGCSYC